MAFVSVDAIRLRLAEMNARRAYFEQKSQTPPDRLARHEVWRHTYVADPYLMGAPDDRVAKRFADVMMNVTELDPRGKLGMHDVLKDDTWTQKFTHMLEEYGSRGGTPVDVVRTARLPILRYFENGDPIALKLFDGYQTPATPFLVKYGRRAPRTMTSFSSDR